MTTNPPEVEPRSTAAADSPIPTIDLDHPPGASADALNLIAYFAKVLADPNRLRLLCILRPEPKTLAELTHELGGDVRGISKALKTLIQAGIVRPQRSPQGVHYGICEPCVVTLCDLVGPTLVDGDSA